MTYYSAYFTSNLAAILRVSGMIRWDGGSVLRKEETTPMVVLLTFMLLMEDLLLKATVLGLFI